MEVFVPFILLSVCIYVLILVYAIRSWRRLQGDILFKAQLRTLLPEVIIFTFLWLLLMIPLLGLTGILSLWNSAGHYTEGQLIIDVVTFIPFLPYSLAFYFLQALIALGLPTAIMSIELVAPILTTILLLLLITNGASLK